MKMKMKKMLTTKRKASSDGGVGLLTILLVVFLVLKLTGHIDWSWFWVLSPYLIPICIALVVLLFALVFDKLSKLVGAEKKMKEDDQLREERDNHRW